MKHLQTGLLCLLLSSFSAGSFAQEQSSLLIRLKQDIFAEMLRFNGNQLKSDAILRWCELPELAEELGMNPTELQRAIYQSFVVAGSDNVNATEIARKMNDDQWALYNNALLTEIERYQQGLVYGLSLSLARQEQKQRFCQQQEAAALKSARTLSTPKHHGG